MKLSAITEIASLCVENISISLFRKNNFIDPLKTSLTLSTRVLFACEFFSSKIGITHGITHAYFL